MLDENTKRKLRTAQRNEITEHHIYRKLADAVKDPHNSDVLRRIGDDERRHYEYWKEKTDQEVRPAWLRVWWYYLIARIFGLTFGIKLMELGEESAQVEYSALEEAVPGSEKIAAEEEEHEEELIALIDEERLRYVGAAVLGLNDALVELTGALAGLTLAFGRAELIAVAGLITGISASLSMAGSEYLAIKSEGGELSPGKAAFVTGLAYVVTVAVLVFPYFVFDNLWVCLGVMLTGAVLVILVFSFYVAVAQGLSFWKRFGEMATISLGIAAISFAIGALVRQFLPVEV
ncbi:MAG: demethoxyubiquinone hydroxylase family protein [Candidatus Brocadiia bacterium]